MMLSAIFTLVSIAVVLCSLGSNIEASKLTNLRNRNEDNSINSERKTVYRRKDFLKVSQAPPNVVNIEMGDRLELQCEVLGSPPPTIHWIRGNNPQQQAEAYESNHLSDPLSTGSGRSKTKSRLIIDCVLPQHEGLYTCVAVAGGKASFTQPTMVLIQGNHFNNLTALLTACNVNPLHPAESVARVTQWNPLTMEYIGSDVTLPCRVTGNPRPSSYWLDGDSEVVGENDPRFKVLPNGDLLILKLRWSDMGGYMCVASNQSGRDNVESFVYPLLKDNS